MHLPMHHPGDDRPAQNQTSRFLLAWRDIVEGLRRYWMWVILAQQDIRLRYRGSILGPFWVTVSTAIMVAAMGVIYPRLLNVGTAEYVPYLAIGMVIWSFLSALMNDACQTFIGAAQIIQQVKIPLSTHAYRVVLRNLISFAHSLVVIPVVMIGFGVPARWDIILTLPALALLAVNGVWISVLLGMLSARFRDIPPIVGNALTVVFFITPVFWHVEALGPLQWIERLNPFYGMVDILRAPLIGVSPSLSSWAMVVGVTVFGSTATFALFARYRPRIVFWI
ncbi:MAG TPA: ABC transporter permease [Pseudorhodoplanes sp.]|nr:ABC transporter permease [Pseudorhodoplanes sp.]